MNRRRFLASSAVACGLGAIPGSASSSEPNCNFPLNPRERLAVASYPFRSEFDPKHHKRTLLEFPQLVVETFGVPGIEPLDEHFASTTPAYLERFRQALKKSKTHVVNIPVGVLHGSFYDPDPHNRRTAIDNAQKWIDVAAAVGSPSVRVHIQPVKGVTPDPVNAAAALKSVAAHGRSKNIVVNLENDDPASEDAPFIAQIIDRAGIRWLRALPDFCNSMLLKKGADYNYQSVDAMFHRACNICHVKEVESDEGTLYQIDVPKTFAIAKRAGYRGYFSMEWDSDGDPYAGTKHLIDLALKALT